MNVHNFSEEFCCKGRERKQGECKRSGSGRYFFFLNMGEITACMNADKNDPEEKRKRTLQEKERIVTGEMVFNSCKELGSSTWMELLTLLGSWIVHAPY